MIQCDHSDPDDLGGIYEHGFAVLPPDALAEILDSLERPYVPNARMRRTERFTVADVKPLPDPLPSFGPIP